MNRQRILVTVGVLGLAFGTGVVIGQYLARPDGRVVSTTRLSPDETLRAWLSPHQPYWSESPRRKMGKGPAAGIDRVGTGEPVALLLDGYLGGGGPLGTERFVWSRDGSKLLLVGRHFWVREDLMLDNGDQCYLLYDLKTAQSWINSPESGRSLPLAADLITGVEFTEPVILKPRAKVNPDAAPPILQ